MTATKPLKLKPMEDAVFNITMATTIVLIWLTYIAIEEQITQDHLWRKKWDNQ